MSDILRPHESQHARPPCPSTSPGAHSDSCPSSLWCHPAISSSVIPFSSCPQSLPASESFPMSQLFARGGQSKGASALASFLPKKSQGWSPSEWTRLLFVFLSFNLLIWCITLIDVHILRNPCIPGINLTWSQWMSFLMYYWILFARILLRTFASMYISDIGL